MKTQTKKVICLLVAIASVLTIVSTVSYAYFTAMADVREQSATLTTGTMNATFRDGNAGLSATLNFGESVTKTFTIQNTGTLESTVQMYWEDLVNTYTNGSLTYTLSYSETENGTYTNLVSNRNVPVANSSFRSNLATDIRVPANTTYYYRLVITLNYLENVNQDADVNARFSTKFAIGNEKLQTTIDKIIASSNGVKSGFAEMATTDEGIYEMADDYGTSYYYRGAVENNYVKFGGFYWRIIRINGDGSVRMIYDGTQAYANGDNGSEIADRFIKTTQKWNENRGDAKYVGWMYGGANGEASLSKNQAQENVTNSDIKNVVDEWYTNNIEINSANAGKNLSNYLGDEIFCNDRSIPGKESTKWADDTGLGYAKNSTGYGTMNRFIDPNKLDSHSWWTAESMPTPQLTCPNENDMFTVTSQTINGKTTNGALTKKIGLITADETVLAGGRHYDEDVSSENKLYYLYKNSNYWTMSPRSFDNNAAAIFYIGGVSGAFNGHYVNDDRGAVAPVINISSEYAKTLIGNGTMSAPYQIPGVE